MYFTTKEHQPFEFFLHVDIVGGDLWSYITSFSSEHNAKYVILVDVYSSDEPCIDNSVGVWINSDSYVFNTEKNTLK